MSLNVNPPDQPLEVGGFGAQKAPLQPANPCSRRILGVSRFRPTVVYLKTLRWVTIQHQPPINDYLTGVTGKSVTPLAKLLLDTNKPLVLGNRSGQVPCPFRGAQVDWLDASTSVFIGFAINVSAKLFWPRERHPGGVAQRWDWYMSEAMTHFNRRFHWWTDDVNHDREEPAHSRWPGVVFDEQVDRGGMFEENENLETLPSELKFSEEKSDI
ncbi:hypothetical protein B0H14DRAFT_3124562 [Mycena olivaceomarginata]|nr:hypothetical protein B0H14DRAFT_3124562 [Mycena olivaceomarginata]